MNKIFSIIKFTLLIVCLIIFSGHAQATGRAGQCGIEHGGKLDAAPTNAAAMCARGIPTAATLSGANWVWTCEGSGTQSDANCSAENCGTAPSGTNGLCASHSGTHATQPATNTATGCTDGVFAEMGDTASNWRWKCNGQNGGSDATCLANKSTVVNGACKPFSGTHSSQPASNTSNGCNEGTYANAPDTSTNWGWSCNGSGGGTNASCTASIATEPALCDVNHSDYDQYGGRVDKNEDFVSDCNSQGGVCTITAQTGAYEGEQLGSWEYFTTWCYSTNGTVIFQNDWDNR